MNIYHGILIFICLFATGVKADNFDDMLSDMSEQHYPHDGSFPYDGKTYLTTTIASYHADRDAGYNEINLSSKPPL